jgi:hypothetical protein
MAKVKLNPVIEQMRGGIGDLVFKRYQGDVIVSRKADMSDVEPSAAQAAQRERFRQAAQYGKLACGDPLSRALYARAAAEKGLPLFSLAVADFFHAPEVVSIDLTGYDGKAGATIGVLAQDDLAVKEVLVTIRLADGSELENGPAVETSPGSGRWTYTAKSALRTLTDVQVTARVTDYPGNIGEGTAGKTFA